VQLSDGEKDFERAGCGDEHNSHETLVGHTKEGGERQSEIKCEDCKHYDEDLTTYCWDCYVCRYKCLWEKAEEQDESSDNEPSEVGGKDCSGCSEDMPY
jgi:hypothetical protein